MSQQESAGKLASWPCVQEGALAACRLMTTSTRSWRSIFKLEPVRWATRVTPFDTWNGNCFVNEPGLGNCPEPRGGDLDFGQGAMLFTAMVHGVSRDLGVARGDIKQAALGSPLCDRALCDCPPERCCVLSGDQCFDSYP
jgi:hypothetical protein